MDDKNFVMVMIGTIAAVIIITLGINMMLADYWSTADSDDRFDYKNDTKIATALLYGDCRDGDVNITTNTTITEDMFYQNLFINYTNRINGNGWKIFVCNYTYFYGEIWNKGNNGSSASGGTGGAGGATGNAGNTPLNNLGTAGKTGTTGAGACPTPASAINTCMSNYTTTGGNGGRGKAGIGGESLSVPFCSFYMTRNYLGWEYLRIGTASNIIYTSIGSLGGCSGGGNGSGTGIGGGGGGGGASGGSVYLSSKHLVIDGTAQPPLINCQGGHGGGGGNATCYGNCCGGGGGGQGGTGGFIMINYDTVDGDMNFSAGIRFKVDGGDGGTGGVKTGEGICTDGLYGGFGGCGKCAMMDSDDGIIIPCGCDTSFNVTGTTVWNTTSTPTPTVTPAP